MNPCAVLGKEVPFPGLFTLSLISLNLPVLVEGSEALGPHPLSFLGTLQFAALPPTTLQ